MRSHYDIVIVGARCAGASTAMLLARAGLRVLVLERGAAGSDTLSTHALMRGGVLQLHRWGLLQEIQAAGTPAIRTTTFHYADEPIEIAIKPRDGFDALYAPRRAVLDPLLVAAACEAGAEVLHGVSVAGLVHDRDGRVRGVNVQEKKGALRTVSADLVIGADGLRSNVARWVRAEIQSGGQHQAAVIYGYFDGLAAQGFHWHYAPGVSVGVIPTNDDRTCVFASLPSHRFAAESRRGLQTLHRQILWETSPALALAVTAAHRVGKLFSFAGASGFLRRCWGPGWALVGDAGLFRDPLTAHGITDALRDAELLARAVIDGSESALARYQQTRDGIARKLMEVSDQIASFQWSLEEAKTLHLELSRHMNAEVELLRSLPASPVLPATGRISARCPLSWPVAAAG